LFTRSRKWVGDQASNLRRAAFWSLPLLLIAAAFVPIRGSSFVTYIFQFGINVKSFGALGNGVLRTDGAMSSGGPVDAYGPAQAISTSPTAPSVTTTQANDVLLSVFAPGQTFSAPTPPPTQRALIQTSSGNYNGIYGGDQIIASAGATGTVVASQTPSQPWVGLNIALKTTGTSTVVGTPTTGTGSGASSVTVAAVTGTTSGNVDIGCVTWYGSGVTMTTPAGWTLMFPAYFGTAAVSYVACYYKVSTGSTGSTTWTCSTICYPAGFIFERTNINAASGNPNLLSSASATFTSADVGKLICVAQATSNGTELCTTIATYVDAHDVTLTAPNGAAGSLTGLEFVYGTSDDAAITRALAASCGGTLLFPTGIYVSNGMQQTPCLTQPTIIQGSGAGLVDYTSPSVITSGGNPGTAIWVLETSGMGSNSSLFYIGSGINSLSGAVAYYKFPFTMQNIALLAGIGGNHDGGCATCDAIYLNAGADTLDHVVIEGWGQDGIGLDGGIWRLKVDGGISHSNGRYGVYSTASWSGGALQQLGFYNFESSFNQLDGFNISSFGGLNLVNSIVQWNVQQTSSGHCEVNLVSSQFGSAVPGQANFLGSWFEKDSGSTAGAVCASPAAAGAFMSQDVFNLGYTNPYVCASGASPAVCGMATSGYVAIPAGVNPTLVVDDISALASSRITLGAPTAAASVGTALGVTCNSTLATLALLPVETGRTAATSFTIGISGTVTTNPLCVPFTIAN
jgi:hypothetical protein